MDPGIIIPLAAFALVAIIVALAHTTKIHDLETEVHYRLGQEELEHQRRMQELERELERVKREA